MKRGGRGGLGSPEREGRKKLIKDIRDNYHHDHDTDRNDDEQHPNYQQQPNQLGAHRAYPLPPRFRENDLMHILVEVGRAPNDQSPYDKIGYQR